MVDCEKMKFLSSLLFALAFTTLVYRVYMTKDVTDLSYTWILLVMASQICLFIYGICSKKLEMIASSIYVLVGILYILSVKVSNNNNDKTEIKK